MRAGLFWLNDGQWASIVPHLPTNLTGPERDDDRHIISGIIHMIQCGAPLARLPARVRSLHNHLQSLQPLVQTRPLGRDLRSLGQLR
jgi:hypothetical protein